MLFTVNKKKAVKLIKQLFLVKTLFGIKKMIMISLKAVITGQMRSKRTNFEASYQLCSNL